jgi:hypothetical protein
MQEPAMHDHHVAHRRRRRHTMAAALITIGALAPAAGAVAQPAYDVGTLTNEHATAVPGDQHPRATPAAITFTNPLGKSRGSGAGAGLL